MMDSSHRANASHSIKEYQVRAGIKLTEEEFVDAINKVTTTLIQLENENRDFWMYLYYVSRMGAEYNPDKLS